MAGFLYFLPGATEGITIKQVRSAGIGYAFDSENCTCRGVFANGPDGGQGVMAADPNRVEKIGCYPDEQISRKIPGSDAWLVMYRDEKPGPSDLARKDQLGGHFVGLNDGHEWLCPVARGAREEDGLLVWYHAVPVLSKLNDNGEFEAGEVIDRYAPLWAAACRWQEVRLGAMLESDGETVSFSFDGLHKVAVEALATNYGMASIECDLLGLLTEHYAIDILDALIDMPTRVELLKKMDQIPTPPDGSSTDAGPSDDSPPTDQPWLT